MMDFRSPYMSPRTSYFHLAIYYSNHVKEAGGVTALFCFCKISLQRDDARMHYILLHNISSQI